MLVIEDRYLGRAALQAWFATDAEAVVALTRRAPFVTAMQCTAAVADRVAALAFRDRAFHTLLIDLSAGEAAWWERMERKTCRYQLRKALNLPCAAVVNARDDEALALINDHIARHPYRAPLGAREWRRMRAHADLHAIDHDGRLVAAHLILRDADRVAALVSATVERIGDDRGLAGALNRLLHWRELHHYAALGVRWYDFGGIVLEEDSPLAPISRFKRGFGGDEVHERIVRICANPLVRTALRLAGCRRKRPAIDASQASAPV